MGRRMGRTGRRTGRMRRRTGRPIQNARCHVQRRGALAGETMIDTLLVWAFAALLLVVPQYIETLF